MKHLTPGLYTLGVKGIRCSSLLQTSVSWTFTEPQWTWSECGMDKGSVYMLIAVQTKRCKHVGESALARMDFKNCVVWKQIKSLYKYETFSAQMLHFYVSQAFFWECFVQTELIEKGVWGRGFEALSALNSCNAMTHLDPTYTTNGRGFWYICVYLRQHKDAFIIFWYW